MGGLLPWSKATCDADCRRQKEECDIQALAVQLGCPEVKTLTRAPVPHTNHSPSSDPQVGSLIMAARALPYTQRPDYDVYVQLLQQMQGRKVNSHIQYHVLSCIYRSHLI